MTPEEQLDKWIDQGIQNLVIETDNPYRREMFCNSLLTALRIKCCISRINSNNGNSELSGLIVVALMDIMGCCEYDGEIQTTTESLIRALEIIDRKHVRAEYEWAETK